MAAWCWRAMARSTAWRSASNSRHHPAVVCGSPSGCACGSAVWLGLSASLEFGPGFPGGFPGAVGVGGPLLVSGVADFEPLPFGGQLPGEGLGAGRAGFVVLRLGVCGLLQGVGFGLRGEAQCPAYVGRGAGLGAFPGEDSCFQLAAVQAADDVGFVADLQRSKYCITHVLEFGVAAVRLEGDGLIGVGDPGGFPVGGGQACAAGVFLAQRGGRAGGQDAELAGQPRLGAGGHPFAERADPVVEPGGELAGDGGGAGGCPLRPGDVVPGQLRQA